MRKVLSLLLAPALLLTALLAAPAATRGASRPDYPGNCGEGAVAPADDKGLQEIAYVAAAVMVVALVGGVLKLRYDTKSASAAAYRPRKPWEQLP